MAADSNHYLWLVQLDIPEGLEGEFNRIYDAEHVPALSKVSGVIDVQRYVLEEPSQGGRRFVTLYRVDSPGVPHSAEWRAASAEGDWQTTIVPHVVNANLSLYRAIS